MMEARAEGGSGGVMGVGGPWMCLKVAPTMLPIRWGTGCARKRGITWPPGSGPQQLEE